MEIKLHYRFGVDPIVVSTENNDPDRNQNVVYQGDTYHIKILKRRIGENSGIYGHLVDPDSTNNLDLLSSIEKIEDFKILSVEPDITPRKLPDGVVT